MPLTVTAAPQDGDPRPISGRLTFWDNIVDQTTDSIKLKATFDNKDHRLWPGQFSRVTLQLAMVNGATVVPQEAIQAGQDGSFVFVVGDNLRAQQRAVTVGQRVGDDIVVQNGLAPGETVVTEGQLRLEQGTQVQLADASGNPQGGRGNNGGRGGRSGGRGRRNGGDASGSGNTSAGATAGGRASS